MDLDVIQREADAYFERNKARMSYQSPSNGIQLFSEFYDRCSDKVHIQDFFEVGCSAGFNLAYLSQKYQMHCYGIDPSPLAVEYGQKHFMRDGHLIEIKCGFSNCLTYADSSFDAVYLGFCLYQVERGLLFKTFSECDRVLRGGYLINYRFRYPS